MTTTVPNRTMPAARTPSHAVSTPLDAVKPPYLMAACVSLGALLLYILTLAPTTQFWDTSEYIAAAYTLGIPHPPGNPLFVLIALVCAGAVGPPGRGARRRDRLRDGLHRLEPVGGEREGLHAEPALHRAHPLAHRALGRPAGRRSA